MEGEREIQRQIVLQPSVHQKTDKAGRQRDSSCFRSHKKVGGEKQKPITIYKDGIAL